MSAGDLVRVQVLEARATADHALGVSIPPPPRAWSRMFLVLLTIIGVFVLGGLNVRTTQNVLVEGELRTSTEVEVYPHIRGVIESLSVEVGDKVESGKILGVIRSNSMLPDGGNVVESKIRRMKSQIELLQSEAINIEVEFELGQSELTLNVKSLRHEMASKNELLSLIEPRLKNANASYRLAEDWRSRGLVAENFVQSRRMEYDSLVTERVVLGAELDLAKSELERLEISKRQQAAKKVGKLQRHKFEVTRLQQQLEDLQARSGSAIVSPINGVVANLLSSLGEDVDPSHPILGIHSSEEEIFARLRVPTKHIANIPEDGETKLRIDAFPYKDFGTIRGYFRTPSSSTNSTSRERQSSAPQYYIVDVGIPQKKFDRFDGMVRLQSGMELSAEITTHQGSLIDIIFDRSVQRRSN